MPDDVEISYAGFGRILNPKIAAGNAIRAQVIYDVGSFELAFVIEKLPTTKAGIQAELARLIAQFADHLKDASRRPIRIDMPDPPGKD
jgi:hypothetical protein